MTVNKNRINLRDPGITQNWEGISPQLIRIDRLPPWISRLKNPGTDTTYDYTYPNEWMQDGALIWKQHGGDGKTARYAQLYVYVTNPETKKDPEDQSGDLLSDWQPWKKVDVNFPKIDPRTGKPFDQFLEWYSPLAE